MHVILILIWLTAALYIAWMLAYSVCAAMRWVWRHAWLVDVPVAAPAQRLPHLMPHEHRRRRMALAAELRRDR